MADTADEAGVVEELPQLSGVADMDEVRGGAIEIPAAEDLLSCVEKGVGVTLGSLAMDGMIGWFDAALYATFGSSTADGVGTTEVECGCEFC